MNNLCKCGHEKEIQEIIEKVCHSLGKPDFNGENHIWDIDGMHWKEFADIFNEHFKKFTPKGEDDD